MLNRLLPLWHFSNALAANIFYGFPARKLTCIGITGTNGKTTSANLATNILITNGDKVGMLTTANFRIADKLWDNDLNMTTTNPWMIQKLLKQMVEAKCKYAVVEVTSHALSQHRVYGIPFQVVAITNVTQDHLDYHGTMERYIAAKKKLFEGIERRQHKGGHVTVFNLDDSVTAEFSSYGAGRKISFGIKKTAAVMAKEIQLLPDATNYKLELEKQMLPISSHLVGEFNVYNMLTASAIAFGLDVSSDVIKAGLESTGYVPGRMEMVDAGQDFSVIVDYAHTPDALKNIYQTIRNSHTKKLIAVLGATGDRDKSKRPLLGRIAGEMADLVIVTNEEPYNEDPKTIIEAVASGVAQTNKTEGKNFFIVEDRGEAIAQAVRMASGGDTVVVSGMGHQKFMKVKDGKIAWDDREVAREALKRIKNYESGIKN